MNLKDKQGYAKKWIDQNCHDGEDRSGSAIGDSIIFNPDELQELINELLADLEKEETGRQPSGF